MKIKGFNKLTLLDYPGKLAAELFTGGCNLRCPFCHNSSLVTGNEKDIPEDEILSYLKLRKNILEGLVITGGEPLIQSDISDFIRKVKAIGYAVKLDTNGCFPDKLRALLDEGLIDYVAMDIKNSKEKYPRTVGVADFDITPVLECVEILRNCKIDYEFRTTVVRAFHEKDDFVKIGKWLNGAAKYCIQGFRDSGDILSHEKLFGFSKEELDDFYSISLPFFTKTEKRY